MRARSIVSASLLFAVAMLPGIGLAMEAVSSQQLVPASVMKSVQKSDEISEINLHGIDLRLASLEPRDVLQDHDNLSNAAGHRASVSFANGSLTARQAAVAVSAQPLTLNSQPGDRETSDYWLLGLVAVMLVTYQLHRKHRFLRPKPFNS